MHRLLFALSAAAAFAAERPNVVLIVSDDHNYRALGCSGNPVLKTPHLDGLAKEGVYFERCFTPNPICTPSRACLYTGQDSWTNGVTFNGKVIHPDSPLLPKLLADAGYETCFIGKWHSDGKPWTRGYTTGGRCWAGGTFAHLGMTVVKWGQEPAEGEPAPQYSTTVFTDDAVDYLKREHPKPFLLTLAYTVGHDPWVAPPGYEGKYAAKDVPAPPNFMAKPPFQQFNPLIRDETVLPFPRVEDDVRQATAEYYAMMEHMDAQIGRLLSALWEEGLDKNTLVIFLSAKGMSMGSHGILGKQTLYEEGIRTPLIIRHPGLKPGSRVNSSLVSTMDMLPTICEAAGVMIPPGVEGRSVLGLYAGTGKPREQLFFSYHDPNRHTVTRAVRTDRYKLIHHLLTDERQLFDLKEDPIEMKNLIGQAESREMEDALTSELQRWRQGPEGK